MPEVIAKLGLKRNASELLYCKGGTVYAAKKRKKGARKAAPRKVAAFAGGTDKGYLYFVNKAGHVARARRKVRRGSK